MDFLHKESIAHGDTRQSNLLFPRDGDAKIIDLDLSAQAGSRYVDGYNNIAERHPEAKENSIMKTIHDRHSMAIILHSIQPNHPAVEKLKDESCPLLTIIEMLAGGLCPCFYTTNCETRWSSLSSDIRRYLNTCILCTE